MHQTYYKCRSLTSVKHARSWRTNKQKTVKFLAWSALVKCFNLITMKNSDSPNNLRLR